MVCMLVDYPMDLGVLVENEAIRRAQQALWEVMRIVTEPGGAAVNFEN